MYERLLRRGCSAVEINRPLFGWNDMRWVRMALALNQQLLDGKADSDLRVLGCRRCLDFLFYTSIEPQKLQALAPNHAVDPLPEPFLYKALAADPALAAVSTLVRRSWQNPQMPDMAIRHSVKALSRQTEATGLSAALALLSGKF